MYIMLTSVTEIHGFYFVQMLYKCFVLLGILFPLLSLLEVSASSVC